VTPIKALLISAILAVLVWAFRHRGRVAMRAGIKLTAVALAGVGVAAVVDPGLTQDLANLVGVTRGTDLMLYVLVVVFAFTQAGTYFRFKELELRFARAVRSQAIAEAVDRDGPPGAPRTA
jgi:hypothetical protein